MRGFRLLLFCAMGLLCLLSVSGAQYWFQSGARASGASGNTGAGVSIETVTPQMVNEGSFAYWVGETLSNGAFIQIGYEIPNTTGMYSDNCTLSGCSGDEELTAGEPAWFWEYFPAGYAGGAFLGGFGADGSVGSNGQFNTYTFNSTGDVWSVYFDGKKVGSVNLGASDSGPNSPVAYAEYADANDNTELMRPVTFGNLSYYSLDGFKMASTGLSYIGYGKTSETNLQNPYGVEEVKGIINEFEAGSGIASVPNNTVLWSGGYLLSVNSRYGNLNSSGEYVPGTSVNLTAPEYVNITDGERAVFLDWKGTGSGSYTGPENRTTVGMYGNVTEEAQWGVQYYVGVNSGYGSASGSGWYDSGSTVNFSVLDNVSAIGYGARALFENWSTGSKDTRSHMEVDGSEEITANWQVQYEVNLTTQYGRASGDGWYDNGSALGISLSEPYVQINQSSRIGFASWSGEYNQSNQTVIVAKPLFLTAEYTKQYLVDIGARDAYGRNVSVDYYTSSYGHVLPLSWLDANATVSITGAVYKGAGMPYNDTFVVTGPLSMVFSLPVYNVSISTFSYIYTPIDAEVNVTFENGTAFAGSTGTEGKLVIEDVPLGYAKGYAEYAGLREGITAAGGSGVVLLFFTQIAAIAIIAVVIVIVAILIIIKMRR